MLFSPCQRLHKQRMKSQEPLPYAPERNTSFPGTTVAAVVQIPVQEHSKCLRPFLKWLNDNLSARRPALPMVRGGVFLPPLYLFVFCLTLPFRSLSPNPLLAGTAAAFLSRLFVAAMWTPSSPFPLWSAMGLFFLARIFFFCRVFCTYRFFIATLFGQSLSPARHIPAGLTTFSPFPSVPFFFFISTVFFFVMSDFQEITLPLQPQLLALPPAGKFY